MFFPPNWNSSSRTPLWRRKYVTVDRRQLTELGGGKMLKYRYYPSGTSGTTQGMMMS